MPAGAEGSGGGCGGGCGSGDVAEGGDVGADTIRTLPNAMSAAAMQYSDTNTASINPHGTFSVSGRDVNINTVRTPSAMHEKNDKITKLLKNRLSPCTAITSALDPPLLEIMIAREVANAMDDDKTATTRTRMLRLDA